MLNLKWHFMVTIIYIYNVQQEFPYILFILRLGWSTETLLQARLTIDSQPYYLSGL